MSEPKVTTDTILTWLKERVERKENIPQGAWLDASFKLNLLLDDEEHQMEVMRQDVAKGKLEILRGQEKRNVAAADLETEASDEYRLMCEQEHRVDRIKEFIRIAKKNAEQGY